MAEAGDAEAEEGEGDDYDGGDTAAEEEGLFSEFLPSIGQFFVEKDLLKYYLIVGNHCYHKAVNRCSKCHGLQYRPRWVGRRGR